MPNSSRSIQQNKNQVEREEEIEGKLFSFMMNGIRTGVMRFFVGAPLNVMKHIFHEGF